MKTLKEFEAQVEQLVKLSDLQVEKLKMLVKEGEVKLASLQESAKNLVKDLTELSNEKEEIRRANQDFYIVKDDVAGARRGFMGKEVGLLVDSDDVILVSAGTKFTRTNDGVSVMWYNRTHNVYLYDDSKYLEKVVD